MIKKILIVDNQKLWPPDSGGPIRVYNMFKNLSKKNYFITYLGTVPYDIFLHNEKQLMSNFKEKIIKINKPILLLNSSLTILTKNIHTFDIVISIYEYFNRKFRKIMNEECKKSDILISTHPWFFPHIKNIKNKILIYDAHNCEYLLKKDYLKKTVLGRVLRLFIKYIEKIACKKSNLIISCSEKDKEAFKKLYKIKDEKIHILPNSVNTKEIKPSTNEEKQKAKKSLGLKNKKTIIFIGTYYEPNNKALEFIIEKLSKLKEYTFLIVGSVNLHFKKKYSNKRIDNMKFYGKLNWKKLKDLYKASDLAINPMFSGSGMNIKMLDYMAAGIPIITTPFGARGIKSEHKKDLIISKPKDFVKNLELLFNNKKLRNKLRKNERRIAKNVYDWRIISKNLENILKNITCD